MPSFDSPTPGYLALTSVCTPSEKNRAFDHTGGRATIHVSCFAPHWPLLVFLIAALALRLVFFVGVLGSDDTAYASDALAMRDGHFVFGADMVSMRIALVAATAASFALFGVSEWSTALPVLFASLLTLGVVYAIGFLLAGRRSATIGTFLYALSPLNILYSTSLLPEVPMAFFASLAVLLIILGLRARACHSAILLSFGAGLAVGAGYLIKEPAALLLGAFSLVGLVQLARGDMRGWLYALPLAGFAAVFAIETAVYVLSSGELLHRFRAIADHQAAAVLGSEKERQLQSLWLYPRSMFLVVNQVGMMFYFLVGFLLLAVRRRWPISWFIVLWFLILFLYLQFGSTSLTSYNALPKQPRYLEALTAPTVILVALWMERWLATSAGPSTRRAAFALLALYATTSLAFTALSYIDRRASTQPIRDVAAFLTHSDYSAIYATSLIANGLPLLLPDSSSSVVARACVGCAAGSCTLAGDSTAGEVWIVPAAAPADALPPVTDCKRWGSILRLQITPPDLHRRAVQALLWTTNRLPIPPTFTHLFHPLRALLQPRYVFINAISESP